MKMGSGDTYYDIYLGFGSNVGNLENNLLNAVFLIRKEITNINIISSSNIYLSSPVGNAKLKISAAHQPDFLNCVILYRMTGANQNLYKTYKDFGKQLLFKLKNIEKDLGRKKEAVRYSPRVIDIDILFIYDNYSRKTIKLNLPELKLPHPEIKNRKFVLLPLLDLCGNLKNIKEALIKIDKTDAGLFQKITPYGCFNKNFTKILKF